MPTIMNAIEQRQDEDKRFEQARKFAEVVMGMSEDFVADKLRREFYHYVRKVAYDNGLEISNGDQRKMYEAMRKTIIERGAIISDNEYVQLYGRVNRPKAETKKE